MQITLVLPLNDSRHTEERPIFGEPPGLQVTLALEASESSSSIEIEETQHKQ